jgi:hypothetical protein
MFKKLSVIAIIVFTITKLIAQTTTVNTINGCYDVFQFSENRKFYSGIKTKNNQTVYFRKSIILNYITDQKITIVQDSAIFSYLPKFNKTYTNLKSIEPKNYNSFLYDSTFKIGEKQCFAILKNINYSPIQLLVKRYKRNKTARATLNCSGATFGIAGLVCFAYSALNSTGRTESPYANEQRKKNQTLELYGSSLLGISGILFISTIIPSVKNHKILHKKMVAEYNYHLNTSN